MTAISIKHQYDSDKLDREIHLNNLQTLLEKVQSPTTLAINGAWGSGKTTFIKLLRAKLDKKIDATSIKNLDKEGEISLYFSAWENDNLSNPFVGFLAEIDKQIQIINTSPKWKGYLKNTSNIISNVLDIAKNAQSPSGVDNNNVLKNVINKYDEYHQSIDYFKKNLEGVIKRSGQDSKIYIFVDELDYCRPNYAIELLGTIKHLFDIEGIIFILAINEEQLCLNIKTLYGNEFEAKTYLRRFIDYKYNLPNPCTYFEFIKHNLEQKILDIPNKEQEISELSNLLNEIIQSKSDEKIRITLRDIEQIIGQFSISLLYLKEKTIIEFNQDFTYVSPYQVLLVELCIENKYFDISTNIVDNYAIFFIRSISNSSQYANSDLDKAKRKLPNQNESWYKHYSDYSGNIFNHNIYDIDYIFNHISKDCTDCNINILKSINLLHILSQKHKLSNSPNLFIEVINQYKKLYQEIKNSISLASDIET
ncbi:MAG: hypothetical protein RLZZ210_355 [Pseudomonadota bacterium]